MAMIAVVLVLLVQDRPWTMHVVDNTSRGADGVRLADADGDGRPEIVTGWEEGGVIRIYRHPGPEKVRAPWPAVTVGTVRSPEDAVFFDADGDGALDVVSACEGSTRALFLHRAPKGKYWDSEAWTTEAIPSARERMMWMFSAPLEKGLAAGGKGKDAMLGVFDVSGPWTWTPLAEVGWIMSIVPADLDGDGDRDLLFSDRKGPKRGVRWLEKGAGWTEHWIGGRDREVMFLALADLDGDGREDITCAVREGAILHLRRKDGGWEPSEIPMPENTGTGKGISVGDVNGDGKADLVVSCENAAGGKSGVFGLVRSGDGWNRMEISGPAGTKFDLVPLVDLDGDGDLDALTCEETENLGVVWYENPLR